MNREQAEALAALLGGDAWQSGGGIYVVLVENGLGQIVGLTDESVCLYEDAQALDAATPSCTILLC